MCALFCSALDALTEQAEQVVSFSAQATERFAPKQQSIIIVIIIATSHGNFTIVIVVVVVVVILISWAANRHAVLYHISPPADGDAGYHLLSSSRLMWPGYGPNIQ